MDMHKTQLYLEEIQYMVLRDRAVREKKSIAQLVREMINQAIAPKKGKDSLDGFVGMFNSGYTNIGQNFKDYLYGDDETIRRLEKEGLVRDKPPKRKKKR